MRYIIIAALCMVVWSGVHAEWPRWGFDNFTGIVVYISPTVKGQGCVGTDFLQWREWSLGIGATPTGWGTFIGRKVWILPLTGALHFGLPWGETRPIQLGVGLIGRW